MSTLASLCDTIISFINNYIGQDEITFLFNLVFAVIIGIMIGKERESRGKRAGIGTFTFVIVGSMLFTFLSARIDFADKSRIAAQIVSGLGFLGGGLIFVSKDNIVRNLTTAAAVWLAGAIGMAIGFGYYLVALFAALVARYLPTGKDLITDKILEHKNHEELEALKGKIEQFSNKGGEHNSAKKK